MALAARRSLEPCATGRRPRVSTIKALCGYRPNLTTHVFCRRRHAGVPHADGQDGGHRRRQGGAQQVLPLRPLPLRPGGGEIQPSIHPINTLVWQLADQSGAINSVALLVNHAPNCSFKS
jgi:hypothetical protein